MVLRVVKLCCSQMYVVIQVVVVSTQAFMSAADADTAFDFREGEESRAA